MGRAPILRGEPGFGEGPGTWRVVGGKRAAKWPSRQRRYAMVDPVSGAPAGWSRVGEIRGRRGQLVDLPDEATATSLAEIHHARGSLGAVVIFCPGKDERPMRSWVVSCEAAEDQHGLNPVLVCGADAASATEEWAGAVLRFWQQAPVMKKIREGQSLVLLVVEDRDGAPVQRWRFTGVLRLQCEVVPL